MSIKTTILSIAFLVISFKAIAQCTVAPSQTTGITLSENSGQLEVSWTEADSANRYLVIARESFETTFTPSDLTVYSNASSDFSVAPAIGGDGSKLVANTLNENISISNLNNGVTYHVTIFVFCNGTSGPLYNTSITNGDNSDEILFDISYCSVGSSSFSEVEINSISTSTSFSDTSNPSDDSTEYYDNTNLGPIEVYQNSDFDLTVNVSSDDTNSAHVIAWIDFNNNGSFNDPEETIDFGEIAANTTSNLTETISVPLNANIGNTRLRLIIKDNLDPTSCDTQDEVQIKDYTVNVNSTNTSNLLTMADNSTSATIVAAEQTINFGGLDAGTGFEAIFFEIEDDAAITDGFNTEVNQITLREGNNNNFDWDGLDVTKIIVTHSPNSDFSGSPTIITLDDTQVTLTGNILTLDLSSASIDVVDNASEFVKIELFLDEQLPAESDQDLFQAEISFDNNGFTTTINSNSFLDEINAGNDILGPELTINVEASQLVFTNTFLAEYYVGLPLDNITVQAQDANGNLDTDYNAEITLASNDANAVDISTSAITAFNAVGGQATFTNIFYDEAATDEAVQATDGTFTTAISSDFDVIDVDQDTQILASVNLISDATLEAIDHSPSGTPIDVFRFNISDLATTDTLSTFVSQVNLVAATTNTANLQQHINTITLTDGTSTFTPDAVSITADSISLGFSTNTIEVLSNSTLTLTAAVTLNETGIQDNSIIALEVDTADHQFQANTLGSNFEESQSNGVISGPQITLTVTATELQFTTQPSNTLSGQPMTPSVVVSATDANGNIDLDYGQTIELISTGPADLSVTTSPLLAVNGIAIFDNILYTSVGEGNTLTATDDSVSSLTSLISNSFDIVSGFNETTTVVESNIPSTDLLIQADLFTDPTSTFEVFSFGINDTGPDGLSTNVTQIQFTPSASNTADWTDHIAGLSLTDGTSVYTPSNVIINDTDITLEFSTPIIVANASNLELSVNAYLNTTSIQDEAIISFEVITTNSSFTANTSGSRFNNPIAPVTITGPDITIDVVGTELSFTTQPSNTQVFNPMSPAVQASLTDVNGNVDTSSEALISIVSTGTLSGGTSTTNADNGSAIFNSIIHLAAGTGLTLDASAPGFNTVTSESFDITDEEVIALQDWDDTTPIWAIDNVSNLSGSAWDTDFYGEIQNNSGNVDEFSNSGFQNEIFGVNNVGAIASANNPEVIELVDVDVSDYDDMTFTFDYEFLALDEADDVISYELFYDNVSQGEVSLLGTGIDQDAFNAVNVAIDESGGEISTIKVIFSVYNNLSDEYIGLDNITLTGSKSSIDYVYNGSSWNPENPDGISTLQDNITIEAGSTSLDLVTLCENLQIDTGASLELNEKLTLAGNLTNNGNLDAADSELNFIGATPQTLSSTSTVETGFIRASNNNDVTLDANINLLRSIQIDNGNVTIAVSDTLTLKSSANGSATIGQIASGSTITGGLIIEQFIPQSNRAFRYISSPISTSTTINSNWQEGQNNNSGSISDFNLVWGDYVAAGHNKNENPGFGTHITGANTGSNGLDETLTGNASIFKWETEFQTWNNVSSTNDRTFTAGEAIAILIRGDRSTTLYSNDAVGPATTLRIKNDATGLEIGSTPVNPLSLNSDLAGNWNLIGNVYQAKVDMQDLLGNANDIQTGFYYVYDPSLNNRGGYVAVDLNTLNGSPVPSSNQDKYLQPGQAFFIQNTGTSPSITFEESYKQSGQAIDLVTRSFSESMLSLIDVELYINEPNQVNLADGTRVTYSDANSNNVNSEDAIKFWNDDESIAILKDGNYLAINKENNYSETSEVQLAIYNYRHQNYQFLIDVQQVEGAILFDAYTDTYTALNPGINQIDFSVDSTIEESTDELRFKIIFDQTNLSIDEITQSNTIAIYPNPSNGRFVKIKSDKTSDNLSLRVIDYQGRVILRKASVENEINFGTTLTPGVYLLEFTSKSTKITKKLIVK